MADASGSGSGGAGGGGGTAAEGGGGGGGGGDAAKLESVKVYCRVRPLGKATGDDVGSGESIKVSRDGQLVIDKANTNYQGNAAFNFDATFGPETKNAAIYEACGANVVRGCIEGCVHHPHPSPAFPTPSLHPTKLQRPAAGRFNR